MITPGGITVIALGGLPEIAQGADLASLLIAAAERCSCALRDDDVLVVAQKIVSKAEGRRVRLGDVTPSPRAAEIAAATGKDPRFVELVLRESRAVLRVGRDVIVVEDARGIVLANAGIDQSNVGGADTAALLLPSDPDASAAALRTAIGVHGNTTVAVIIADSLGRAWRLGTLGHAIGAAGLPALVDLRGRSDRHGRTLRHTEIALADGLAAAGVLVMGEADEGRPAAVIRGFSGLRAGGRAEGATRLQRPLEEDLFR
ncbi:MAG TPA: coenzyme F420-0:L-glutamate ligase [Steroidobacteraceae bacterium]|nr:coenzyme F420-0:L-glutamate ligase [Steroidobacteraceae bacterium]